jgi:hypothetical protein
MSQGTIAYNLEVTRCRCLGRGESVAQSLLGRGKACVAQFKRRGKHVPHSKALSENPTPRRRRRSLVGSASILALNYNSFLTCCREMAVN